MGSVCSNRQCSSSGCSQAFSHSCHSPGAIAASVALNPNLGAGFAFVCAELCKCCFKLPRQKSSDFLSRKPNDICYLSVLSSASRMQLSSDSISVARILGPKSQLTWQKKTAAMALQTQADSSHTFL